MAYQYLFPPTTQFQARTGANNTAGFLRVFYTQTDDHAMTYSDFGGTPNEEDIVLDADGRAVVIVDDTKTYRLEVYNRNTGLLFTIDPLTPVGGGSGGANITKVISTDGTVKVQVVSGGGVTYYDLSTSLSDTPSKWGAATGTADSVDGSGDWVQIQPVSTLGSVIYDYGWTAEKDTGYDIAASVEMPAGAAVALYGIDVKCEFQVDGVTVQTEYGLLDPSENMGRVSFEWKGELVEGQKVDTKLFVRCSQAMAVGLVTRALYNEECDGIVGGGSGGGGAQYEAGQYIDINAAKVISVTGVQPASAMIFYAPNSALSSKQDTLVFNYNGSNISGINGSAIDAGSLNLSAGEYIDISGNTISVTGVQPLSGMSSYVERTAFDDCCSAMSGYVSSLQNDVSGISSVVSGITGATGNYVEKSSISAESAVWNTVTGKQPSGNYLSSTDSGNFILTSQSGMFQPSGYYQPSGSYLSSTDSSLFYPMTGNPSSFVQAGAISAESATWNEVSAKLDESAFTSYTATAAQFTGVTTDSSLTGYGLTSSPLGVNRMELDFDSSITTSVTGNTATVGVNTAILSGFQYASAMTAYQPSGDYAYNSAVSGKADQSSLDDCCSAMSSEVSALKTDVSSLSSTVSSLTGTYLEQSASAMFALSSQAFTGVTTDGTLTGDGTVGSALGVNRMELDFDSSMSTSVTGNTATVGVNAAILSGKLDTSAQVVTAIGVAAGALSSINNYGLSAGTANSAGTALYDSAGRTLTSMATKAEASGIAMAYAASAVSSVSAEYYSTSNPSGFITGVDLSPYQTTAGMSAYAYESSNSAKLDATAFSTVSGNFLTSETVTALGDDGVYITSINGSALAAGVDSATVSAIASSYAESAASGKQDSSGMSAYAYESSNSAKLDSTAFSTVSGTFLTSVDLTPYQLTADMSGYLQTGESSNYLLTSQSGMFQPSGYYLTTADIGIGEI